MTKKEAFPTYKGKPLVRCGDVLFYGNMDERYVIRLQIKTKKNGQRSGGCRQGCRAADVY